MNEITRQKIIGFLENIGQGQDIRPIFADWLEENHIDRLEGFGFPFALNIFDIYSFGFGIGHGSGIGSGIGRGNGSGNGSGSGHVHIGDIYMEIGKSYLVHCGDWHTFVGRCAEMVSPVVYRMESVSKIYDTNNGDCWNKLADGDQKLRAKASYRHSKEKVTLPLAIAALEWFGKTPQEDGLPEEPPQ